MGCLADVVDMLIEGQPAVYCDTQALYCCCDRNCGVGNLNSSVFPFDLSFVPEPIVSELEAVINNFDGVISVECYI